MSAQSEARLIQAVHEHLDDLWVRDIQVPEELERLTDWRPGGER